jgi:hypothetical protein
MRKSISIDIRSPANDNGPAGTIQDAEDMHRLGKKQELNVKTPALQM